MADVNTGGGEAAQTGGQNPFASFFRWFGLIISVVLVAGIAVWAYRLELRDASGLPVIQAAEGPMRIVPDDPGGERAAHQGLAVNMVAAEGEAKVPTEDQLVLAPAPLNLADDDLPGSGLDARFGAADDNVGSNAMEMPAQFGEQGEGGLMPQSDPASAAGGPRPSMPKPRPPRGVNAEAVAGAVALAMDERKSAGGGLRGIPSGTQVAQFGAFDSPEDALAEWSRINSRFKDVLAGKRHSVQETVSNGETMYRMLAVGFDGADDAQRFCEALQAAGQSCVPALIR